jgi:hypothetical protein
MKRFGDVFYEQCKLLIDKNYKEKSKHFSSLGQVESALLQEVLGHANFCNETAEKFHGRQDILLKVFSF